MGNIDLSDTDLDLLDTDIPSKHFVCLQNVFETCLKMSSRRLQCNNFSSFHLPRHLQDIFKKFSRRLPRLAKTS